MFTGIIETLGKISHIDKEGSNLNLTIESSLTSQLKIDQSVSHDGICLTVVDFLDKNSYRVTAIKETIDKSSINHWKVNQLINLERSSPINGRLDGHIVQGHVDKTAICTDKIDTDGSWIFSFSYEGLENVTIKKGSIAVNGVSLTVVESEKEAFSIAIIPYTYQHTNFKFIKPKTVVNLEFDVLGKYIVSYLKQLDLKSRL